MFLRVLKPEDQEKEQIRQILKDLAEYYSMKLSGRQTEMYLEDLLEMGSENVKRAVLKYRRDWNSSSFPLPAVLRKQIFFSSTQKVPYA